MIHVVSKADHGQIPEKGTQETNLHTQIFIEGPQSENIQSDVSGSDGSADQDQEPHEGEKGQVTICIATCWTANVVQSECCAHCGL